jgi:hypothetical protein
LYQGIALAMPQRSAINTAFRRGVPHSTFFWLSGVFRFNGVSLLGDAPLVLVIPSGLQAARNLLFAFRQQSFPFTAPWLVSGHRFSDAATIQNQRRL